MGRGREAVTGRRGIGGEECWRSKKVVRCRKNKRRTLQWKGGAGQSRLNCSIVVVVDHQVAKSIRPQDLLRPGGEQGQSEIGERVFDTVVHIFERINLCPLSLFF